MTVNEACNGFASNYVLKKIEYFKAMEECDAFLQLITIVSRCRYDEKSNALCSNVQLAQSAFFRRVVTKSQVNLICIFCLESRCEGSSPCRKVDTRVQVMFVTSCAKRIRHITHIGHSLVSLLTKVGQWRNTPPCRRTQVDIAYFCYFLTSFSVNLRHSYCWLSTNDGYFVHLYS